MADPRPTENAARPGQLFRPVRSHQQACGYILLSFLDDGKISLFTFLDLSCAFDCVDHTILSECLKVC